MTQPALTFGPFDFDPDRAALTNGETMIPLGHRGAALLKALLNARGQPVSKAHLMEAAWPGLAVEEGNLTVQIGGLRKALGHGPQGQDWIVTVPRMGYRLVLPSQPMAQLESPKPALAVLPFVNLSGDLAQDYFADGVVEGIITALSRFKSFAVIARNSSFTYKGQTVDVRQVGRDLGVRYVLEGSLRRAGDRLRISTQLVECAGGQQIWAETFEGPIEQVFEFQDRITESVVARVAPSIQAAEIERSRRERPGSMTAYDLHLQVLSLPIGGSEAASTAAYGLLGKAIQLEPTNAVFLAEAAVRLSERDTLGWPPIGANDRADCTDLVNRALQHASGDAIALVYCGHALLHLLKDGAWAMSVYDSAVRSNPNNFLVVVLSSIGHLHCGNVVDAVAGFHRAIELSPLDPNLHIPLTGIAHAHMILGEFDAALAWATRSLTVGPAYVCTFWMLIAANAQLGRLDEARRHLTKFLGLMPGATIARIRAGQPDYDPQRLAAILDGMRLAGLPEA